MKLLKKYNTCIFCGSKNLKKKTVLKKLHSVNFYLEAILSDLNLSLKDLNKMKLYDCNNCFISQYSPWFDEQTTKKIYNNIYGQHNKNWSNLLNFIRKGKDPAHGKLFDYINKKITVSNYAEYNAPFMGLFINFFKKETKLNTKKYKKLFDYIFRYIQLRQLAGRSKIFQKRSMLHSFKLKKSIDIIKKDLLKRKEINKYLIYDNSAMCWNYNDNYKSINSKVFVGEMFNVNIYELEKFPKKIQFDLFGFFLTLDHTLQPKRILDFALAKSKYVIINCHIEEIVNKQHLFSLTMKFKEYLKKKKIYYLDLNKAIEKKFTSPELYLICSKNRLLISKLN